MKQLLIFICASLLSIHAQGQEDSAIQASPEPMYHFGLTPGTLDLPHGRDLKMGTMGPGLRYSNLNTWKFGVIYLSNYNGASIIDGFGNHTAPYLTGHEFRLSPLGNAAGNTDQYLIFSNDLRGVFLPLLSLIKR